MSDYRIALDDSGIRPGAVLRLLEALDEREIRIHSLLLRRHGRVVFRAAWAPYTAETPHILYSLSKTFTSLAVGLAEAEGKLSRDDRVTDLLGDLLAADPCPMMQAMTVEHLLTMNTGHEREPDSLGAKRPEKHFMESYVGYEPGTRFVYNTPATYMLAAIVEKVTGEHLLDYLRTRVLDPIGISKDFGWGTSPTGVAWGGFGAAATVDDLGRLGELLLRRGRWDGREIVPAEWVDTMHRPHSDNAAMGGKGDWGQGYGYQVWRCKPEHVYRGDGAYGQNCIVCPEQDLVIANTAGIDDLQGLLDVYWAFLEEVDAEPARGAEAATQDARDLGSLEAKVRSLDARDALVAHADIPTPEVGARPPIDGTYRLSAHPAGIDTLRWDTTDRGYRLTAEASEHTWTLNLVPDTWVAATAPGGYRFEVGAPDPTADEQLVCRLRDASTTEGATVVDIAFPHGPMTESWVFRRVGEQGLAWTVIRRTSFAGGTHEVLGVRVTL